MDRTELLQNNSLLLELFKNSEAATLLLNVSGEIVLVNDRLVQLTGFTKEEIEGQKHWKDIIIARDIDAMTGFLSILKVEPDEEPEKLEVAFLDKNDAEKHCYLKGKYLKEFDIIVLSVVDITDQKQTERKLAAAKESAENSERIKTAFLANMSHEIRTPINSIIGFADLLKLADLSEEKKRLYLDQVVNGSNDLLLLIEKIIAVSRLDAGHVRISNREFKLNKKLKDLYDRYAEDLLQRGKSEIELVFNPANEDDEFIINGDPIRILEVMSNLIENAIKFTERGRVEFGYYHMSDKNNGQVEESLLFFVKDSGSGIEKKKKNVIFDRFVKVIEKEESIYKGAGLGLSICKAVVELWGGSIWVESTKEKGSRFFFSYPLAAMKNKHISRTGDELKQSLEMDWSDKEILIAEDVESNYFYVKELLASTNVKILRARDGAEAVDLFKKTPDLDLVIMDILMPGMDGYEATTIIRKISPDIPVIAQSAFTFEGEMQNGLYAGCFNDYIMKPYTRKVLLAVMKKYFASDTIHD